MDREHQKLKNDIALFRDRVVNPLYWLALGLGLLMILPKFSMVPDFGVTFWHVWGVIVVACVARFAGYRWVSWRADWRLKNGYPEMFSIKQEAETRADT